MKNELGVEFSLDKYSYRVLLKSISIPEVTKGGVHLPTSYRNAGKREHNIGLVLGMGNAAFQDKERFPSGATCEVGDWVFYSPYEKIDEHFGDHLCFFINDDRILGPIPESALPYIVPELRGPDWSFENKEAV